MATRTTAQTTPTVTLAQLREIAERFEFDGRDEVEAFLAEHPYLVPLLLDAREVISRYFGQAVPVDLEAVIDAEGDGYRELYALIRTRLRPPESRERLHRFDDEWWLDASARAQGQLTTMLRYA